METKGWIERGRFGWSEIWVRREKEREERDKIVRVRWGDGDVQWPIGPKLIYLVMLYLFNVFFGVRIDYI